MATLLINETMAAAPTTPMIVRSANCANVWNAGGYYVLNTSGVQYAYCNLEYTGALPAVFTTSADIRIPSVGGADSHYFYFGCSTSPPQEDSACGGYIIYRSEYYSLIAIRFNGVTLASAIWSQTNSWCNFSISYNNQTFIVAHAGVNVLTYTDPTPRTLAGNKYGWGARSGMSTNEHDIKNIQLSAVLTNTRDMMGV